MEQKAKSQMRIFLSSTFVDMQKERDYLVKKIFPSIKAECRRRGVDFVALDLRWGINEETARSGKVVEICMDEIVRSRPFFIGLIGGRYGWIPEKDDGSITETLMVKYPWVKDCVSRRLSITEMEMQFGVLDNPEHINAFFFQKDEIAIPRKFRDPRGSEHAQKLSRLKEAVKEAADAGKCSLGSYSTLKALGRQVHDALMAKIDELYPLEQNSRFAMYSRKQHEFLESRRNIYVRYDKAPDLKGAVLVTGRGGIGKSSLVANYAETALQKGGYLVYTVINNEVNTAEMCRRMFLYELSLQFPSIDVSVLDRPMDVTVDIVKVAKDAGFDGDVLWVIDGIDKLSVPEERSATWLKGDSDIILTTSRPSEINPGVLAGLRQVEVAPLKPGEIMEITKTYLKGFAKALSGTQESHISNSPLLKNPETLRVFLEELLQFGVHEKLGEFIDGYLSQKTVAGFYSKILERFDRDFGSKRMRTLFGSLMMCDHGIPEESLIGLLGVNNIEWVAIDAAIHPFISVSGGYVALDDANMASAADSHYDIRSMRRQTGMVNRLARILKKEKRAMVKAADRRLIKEDGKFSYFLSKMFAAFSAVYSYSHMYFTPVEEIHYGGNDCSMFAMYVKAGRLRKAMRLAKRGALYNIMGDSISGLESLNDLLKERRNHVSEFIGIGDSLLLYLDDGMSVTSMVVPLLAAIEDPVRREEEKRRVIRKIKWMPMPSDGRKRLLSVLNDENEFSDLESLLNKETFDMDDTMNIGKRICEVFTIHSEDRLRKIASVALDVAGRLDESDPICNLCHLIAGAAYMRLGEPDADKYITDGVGNGLNVENFRVFFDEYELFKAVKCKDDAALESMMVRTVSYREKGIYTFLATYFRVRFVQCAALDEDEKEKRFKELVDEFTQAFASWGDLCVAFDNEGERLYNMELYDIAGRLYERAALVCDASKVDTLVRLWRYVGSSAQKDGDVQKAADAFKRGLDIRKDYALYEDLENLYRTSGNPREALFWARQTVDVLKDSGRQNRLSDTYNRIGVNIHNLLGSDRYSLSKEERAQYFKEAYEAYKESERLDEGDARITVTNRAYLVFESYAFGEEIAGKYVAEHVRLLEEMLLMSDADGRRFRHIGPILARGYVLAENWRGLKKLRDEFGLKADAIDANVYHILYNCAEDKESALNEIADDFAHEVFFSKYARYDLVRKRFIHSSDRWKEIKMMGVLDPLLEVILRKASAGDADAVPYAYTVKAVGDLLEDPLLEEQGRELVCNAIMNDPLAFRHYDRLCFMMPLTGMLLENGWTQAKLDLMIARKEVDSVCREGNITEVSNAIAAIMKTDAVIELMSELVRGVLDANIVGGLWACLNNIGSRLDAIVGIMNNAYTSGSDAGREEADKFLELVSELLDSCVSAMLNSFREGMTDLNDDRTDTMLEVMDRLRLPVDPILVWLKMMTVDSDPDAVLKLWEDYPDCHVNALCQTEYVMALRFKGDYGRAESLVRSYMDELETDLDRAPLARQLMFVMRNTGRYEEGLELLERYENVGGGWDFSWLKALFLAYTGRPADALLLLEKTWDGSDSDCYTKAVFLLRQGLLKDAEKAVAGCGPMDEDKPDFMYVLYLIELARYWKNGGDVAKAGEMYALARSYMDKAHMGMCEYEASGLGLEI